MSIRRLGGLLALSAVVLAVAACGGGGGAATTTYSVHEGGPVNITLNSDGTFVWNTGPGNLNEVWRGTYTRDNGAKTVTLVIQQSQQPSASSEPFNLTVTASIDAAGCISPELNGEPLYTQAMCPAGVTPAPI
jgi:hypothetical protein